MNNNRSIFSNSIVACLVLQLVYFPHTINSFQSVQLSRPSKFSQNNFRQLQIQNTPKALSLSPYKVISGFPPAKWTELLRNANKDPQATDYLLEAKDLLKTEEEDGQQRLKPKKQAHSKNLVPRLLDMATNFFPGWVLLAAVLGYHRPHLFSWFTGNLITMALACTMLFMGMTLTVEDFQSTLQNPRVVFLGVAAQYGIMPFLGWIVAKTFRLPSALAAGIILVGCCPGGTASNLVALIAKADVALSVMMTSASTMTAAILTPLLTKFLVGSLVPINGKDLLFSTIQVVLAPVAVGLTLNTTVPKLSKAVSPFTPLVSVLIVAMICGSVVASNAVTLSNATIGKPLIAAVALLHLGGFALGYCCTKYLGRQSEKTCRTVSIEVGMQNSALAVVLAAKTIADPSSSLPGAISATCHSLLGSCLAGIWRSLSDKNATRK